MTFFSCGPFIVAKKDSFIKSKGYNPEKDTLIVKPYEYYSKQKGYGAHFEENNCVNKKDIKIDIEDFVDKDSMPFDRMFKNMRLIFGDQTAILNHAELLFIRKGSTPSVTIDKQVVDTTCSCSFSFEFIEEKWRKKSDKDALLIWNVSVSLDGTTYCIPNRVYYLK